MDLSFTGILEALFSLIIVAVFIFIIWAKCKKKPALEFYNETMDKIMGMETTDVNIKNPLSGLKRLNIRNKTLR